MSLRSYLTALVLAALVPLGAFSVWVALLLIQHQHDVYSEGAQARALTLMTAVDAELDSSVTTLRALSSVPSLSDGDLAYFRRAASDILASQPGWVAISLATPSRDALVFIAKVPSAGAAEPGAPDASFARTLSERRAVVGNVETHPALKRWTFPVRTPVARGDEIRYVLTAHVAAESMRGIIDAQRLPADWGAVILDGGNRFVWRNWQPEKFAGNLASQSLRDALARGNNGWFQGRTVEGVDVYSPYWRSEKSGWTVSMGYPVGAIDAAARRAAWLLGGGMLLALAIAILVALLIGRRIARPIAMLAAATGNIGAGRGAVLPPAEGVDEVRKLNAALRASVQAMQEREQRFRLMADSAPVLIWLSGPDKLCTWFNNAWLEFVGRTMEQELGNGWAENVHPDDLARCLATYSDAFEARQPFRMEYRLRRSDGEYRWVFDHGIPRFEPGGEFVGYIGSCIDITERRQAEETLRQAEERTRSIVDHVIDGIITIDERGIIQSFNRAAERQFGYAAAEVAGQNVKLLMPEPYRGGHDGYIDNYLRTGQAKIIGIGREVEGRRKDGSTFPMELGVSELYIAGRRYFTGIVRDISERKRAEEALRASEERLRLAMEAGRMGSWEWDVATGAVKWSPALEAIHGLAPGAFPGTFAAYEKDIHPDDRGHVREAIARNLAGGADHHVEYRIVWPDGSVHWVEGRGKVFRDASGTPLRVVGVCTDVTARKDAEAALVQADRQKDEFLAMLGHELRNPLAALTGAAHVLKVSDPAKAGAIKARRIVERQTKQMARLIDDLLDISRIRAGKMTLERAPLALDELARQVVSAWQTSGRFADRLVSCNASRVWIDADRARIEQIVSNLLDNAVKFTAPGKAICLNVKADYGQAVIEVADGGEGMPAELLSRIFEPFAQGEERARGGLGLGLALVRRLAELHGGSASATSDGPGKGSTFTVRLPALQKPATQPGAKPAPAVAGSRRILVVEDNDDARHMLQATLALSGHEVSEARNGRTGLAVAESVRPEVALIDIGLPDIDGYEVARRLRDSQGSRIHLIALTGYGQPDDERRAREAGFDVHLTKPVSAENLQRALARLP